MLVLVDGDVRPLEVFGQEAEERSALWRGSHQHGHLVLVGQSQLQNKPDAIAMVNPTVNESKSCVVCLPCKGAAPRAPRRFAWESASWSWSQWTNTGPAASPMTGVQSAPDPCGGSFPAPPPRSACRQFLSETFSFTLREVLILIMNATSPWIAEERSMSVTETLLMLLKSPLRRFFFFFLMSRRAWRKWRTCSSRRGREWDPTTQVLESTYLGIAPHVGPTMRRRNVEQSDSLQRRTIRQVEGDAITLGENSNKSHLWTVNCWDQRQITLTISSMFSCRFLHEDENCSEVAYSKYHILFFMRLLNLFGFFSLSRWNLQQIAASWNVCGWRCFTSKKRMSIILSLSPDHDN